MNNLNLSDLSGTIAPKSDQLNADDLIAGPLTVTISGIRAGTPDQPVWLDLVGEAQPYKPCLTCRRIFVKCWGKDGNQWVGKSMTLIFDGSVMYGGKAVGGIRVSHLSHINGPFKMLLTTTRSRRTEYTFQPLQITPPPQPAPVVDPNEVKKFCTAMEMAGTVEHLQTAYKSGYEYCKSVGSLESANALKVVYEAKKAELSMPV